MNENHEQPEYGARVERGVVIARDGDRYTVRSLDRPGLVSLRFGVTEGGNQYGNYYGDYQTRYAIGARIYFVLFPDGHGIILGRVSS